MNMLAFDPVRVISQSHNFLRVLQYFAIPPKLYNKSEAVVSQERVKELNREELHQS